MRLTADRLILFFGLLFLLAWSGCIFPFDSPNPKLPTPEEFCSSHTCFQKSISGQSMMPILRDEDLIWVGVDYYQYYPMQRRDIVIIDFNMDNNLRVKRLAGLPGDKVWINGAGDLQLNDSVILRHLTQQPRAFESFAFFQPSLFPFEKIIPKGKVLVLSDNFLGVDSREWGFIDSNALVGKVFTIYPVQGYSAIPSS
jgi:signal peptidase I